MRVASNCASAHGVRYNHAVRVLFLLLVAVGACSRGAPDPLDDFHAAERRCIAAFNDALARQRANQIDEAGLAAAIDEDVLPPWRDMRARMQAAQLAPELREPMQRYLEARQTAWEAYTAALRAPSDAAARPHYDVYHEKDAEADAAARALGPLLH